MPTYLRHTVFSFFIIVALTGIWMRLIPLHSIDLIPYTHLLHGHSHLAFLGWVFLGLILIFLKLFWPSIRAKKQIIPMTITLIVVTILMFIAFLYQGYALFSIILSTLHIFIQYWVAIFIYREMKQLSMPSSASLFMKGGLVTLVISSFSPFSLGFIAAKGLQDSPFFDMAIYFYLHFQYNGWFFLFLIGLFIAIIHRKNIHFNQTLLTYAFWLYFIALFPSYLHSILWAELGRGMTILSAFGSIGQWIAVLLILISFKEIYQAISSYFGKLFTITVKLVFILLFVKHTLELGLMIPELGTLVYESRSVIIGYLHLTLLGFVSLFLFIQFYMIGLFRKSSITVFGFSVFIISFLLNEGLLFMQGLTEWTTLPVFPYILEGLLLASILLAISGFCLWYSSRNNSIENIY